MNSIAFQITAAIIGIVIGLVYYKILAKKSNDNRQFRKALIICVLAIILVNTIADVYVLSHIAQGEKNWFSIIILALLHSAELFVFQTHFFDNGYQEFLFGDQGQGHPGLCYLFIITFILAIVTSIAFVIKAFNRRKVGFTWLSTNKDKAHCTHVFFFGGELSYALAYDILKCHPDQPRLLVDYPDPEQSFFFGLSVWEKIQHLFKSRTDGDNGPFNAILYSRIPLSETTGKNICRQMSLKDLDTFLKNSSCKVYLLSDNDDENLCCAEKLYRDGCKAEIFCRACRDGVNKLYEATMTKAPSINVHLIDSSYLAVRNIKNGNELLPVNYVEKGLDHNGLREGWVSTGFNAMILGFGVTGREMLGFLYEYGSFVGKDFKKSPFTCVAIDRRMDVIEQTYRMNYPGMNEEAGITYKDAEIGGKVFWADMEKRIDDLNYVVVCMGNDRLNLRVAINLVEFAFRHGKDLSKNFVVLIAQEAPSHLDQETLKHYNSIAQYGNCIRTFGNLHDVWTYDNITNESLTAKAKAYHAGYMSAQGDKRDPNQIWDEREKEIVNTGDFAIHAKRVRQRSQDYANCFHVTTKLALIGPEIYQRRHEIAQCIPPDFKTTQCHYSGSDAHEEKVLRYLAVQEHLRWEASHVALGYTYGPTTDEVKKTHECIKSFEGLSPEVHHYDYLVVKTSLGL